MSFIKAHFNIYDFLNTLLLVYIILYLSSYLVCSEFNVFLDGFFSGFQAIPVPCTSIPPICLYFASATNFFSSAPSSLIISCAKQTIFCIKNQHCIICPFIPSFCFFVSHFSTQLAVVLLVQSFSHLT